MIRHVVLWKLKDFAGNNDKYTNAKFLKKRLLALKDEISEIRKISVGINITCSPYADHDVMLDTEFDSMADLKKYQDHPKHKEIVALLSQIRELRASIDYEI